MQFLKLYVFFLQVPFGPASGHIDLVDKGFRFEQTEFDFGHLDLNRISGTEIVENWDSMVDSQNIIVASAHKNQDYPTHGKE